MSESRGAHACSRCGGTAHRVELDGLGEAVDERARGLIATCAVVGDEVLHQVLQMEAEHARVVVDAERALAVVGRRRRLYVRRVRDSKYCLINTS